MCDCYGHKCQHEGCAELIPMHIGDFKHPRTDVEAWCTRHIPKREPGAEVFRVTKAGAGYRKGTRFAIRLKGGALRPSDEDVAPNLGRCEEVGDWTPVEKP